MPAKRKSYCPFPTASARALSPPQESPLLPQRVCALWLNLKMKWLCNLWYFFLWCHSTYQRQCRCHQCELASSPQSWPPPTSLYFIPTLRALPGQKKTKPSASLFCRASPDSCLTLHVLTVLVPQARTLPLSSHVLCPRLPADLCSQSPKSAPFPEKLLSPSHPPTTIYWITYDWGC